MSQPNRLLRSLNVAVAAVEQIALANLVRAGKWITDDVPGNLLQQVTRGARCDVRYRFSYSTLRHHPSPAVSC